MYLVLTIQNLASLFSESYKQIFIFNQSTKTSNSMDGYVITFTEIDLKLVYVFYNLYAFPPTILYIIHMTL